MSRSSLRADALSTSSPNAIRSASDGGNVAAAPSGALMDTLAAAKYLDASKRTLDAWRVRGGGPVFCRVGRLVKYRQRDLDAFVAAGERRNTSEIA